MLSQPGTNTTKKSIQNAASPSREKVDDDTKIALRKTTPVRK